MTITELIRNHLRSAAHALKDRNFDDFAFAIRSLASFSEADKLSPQIAHSVAEVKLFSEWLRLNGSDYTKYLDEISVLFGKQRANGRLADAIHYMNDEKRRATNLKEFAVDTMYAVAAGKVQPDWKIDRTHCCKKDCGIVARDANDIFFPHSAQRSCSGKFSAGVESLSTATSTPPRRASSPAA